MIQINLFGVLAASIAATVVGFLWYGPLFGKKWSALAGMTSEKMAAAKKKGMAMEYTVNFIATLVMAYVLARSIDVRGITDIVGAAWVAFWIWLGFVATVLLSVVLWEGKPVKLYLIQAFGWLAILLVMAVMIVLIG